MQISLLWFFKTFQKYLPYAFLVLFISLLQFLCLANAILGLFNLANAILCPIYHISSYSFRGKYSFLNLPFCTVTFDHST